MSVSVHAHLAEGGASGGVDDGDGVGGGDGREFVAPQHAARCAPMLPPPHAMFSSTDLLLGVFRFLPPKQLARASRVSRLARDVALRNSLWRPLVQRLYRFHPVVGVPFDVMHLGEEDHAATLAHARAAVNPWRALVRATAANSPSGTEGGARTGGGAAGQAPATATTAVPRRMSEMRVQELHEVARSMLQQELARVESEFDQLLRLHRNDGREHQPQGSAGVGGGATSGLVRGGGGGRGRGASSSSTGGNSARGGDGGGGNSSGGSSSSSSSTAAATTTSSTATRDPLKVLPSASPPPSEALATFWFRRFRLLATFRLHGVWQCRGSCTSTDMPSTLQRYSYDICIEHAPAPTADAESASRPSSLASSSSALPSSSASLAAAGSAATAAATSSSAATARSPVEGSERTREVDLQGWAAAGLPPLQRLFLRSRDHDMHMVSQPEVAVRLGAAVVFVQESVHTPGYFNYCFALLSTAPWDGPEEVDAPTSIVCPDPLPSPAFPAEFGGPLGATAAAVAASASAAATAQAAAAAAEEEDEEAVPGAPKIRGKFVGGLGNDLPEFEGQFCLTLKFAGPAHYVHHLARFAPGGTSVDDEEDEDDDEEESEEESGHRWRAYAQGGAGRD